ncbi:Protein ANTAGONIST OF LIKE HETEROCHROMATIN PROTEIN 1 [Frankliniella fusca]|uniref:Protein ANTAGONIST OF LIKE HETEROCHROMATIN PROTEIN 1 n=1 Tax=Frankliniella fusca TaxID=407009 RepID=A0AAE1LWH1_9NEOP|nr:Protein ANTAGONIST OF LIKE HETEROCHROMATIN PROTEIN 1 [Frankliniella fusca]
MDGNGNIVYDVYDDDDEDDEVVAAVIADECNATEVDDFKDGGCEHVQVDIQGWRALSNGTFKENFRMDRTVFQRLIVVVGNYLQANGILQRRRTPLDLSLLMGLWPIFNPDTYRSSGKHFGKSKSVIHFHYVRAINALTNLAPFYIKWPDAIERDCIKVAFEEKYGYPGVCGCMDGVQIDITAPLEQAQRYVNYHDRYAILVQAVCDNRLLYRDLYVGQPGSVGDARNFQRSPLSSSLLLREDMLSDNEHILADGAYTLSDKVMIPYVNDGHLTPRMRTHNYVLSSCRAAVERSFALLRGKHRRLKKLPMRNMELTIKHIVASFVLHNLIILEGFECPVSFVM